MTSKQVSVELLNRIRYTLAKQATDRDAALAKVAQLEAEAFIYKSVLTLVNQGAVDPIDALSKVAEFQKNPERLELSKQAAAYNYMSLADVGVLETSTSEFSESTDPEHVFLDRLKTLL